MAHQLRIIDTPIPYEDKAIDKLFFHTVAEHHLLTKYLVAVTKVKNQLIERDPPTEADMYADAIAEKPIMGFRGHISNPSRPSLSLTSKKMYNPPLYERILPTTLEGVYDRLDDVNGEIKLLENLRDKLWKEVRLLAEQPRARPPPPKGFRYVVEATGGLSSSEVERIPEGEKERSGERNNKENGGKHTLTDEEDEEFETYHRENPVGIPEFNMSDAIAEHRAKQEKRRRRAAAQGPPKPIYGGRLI